MWFYFRAARRERIGLIALALALIPASYLVNLIAAANEGPYRTLTAISALSTIYFFLALRGFASHFSRRGERIMNGVAVMTTLAGVLAAFYTSTVYVAIPQNKELQMIRQQLAAQMRPNTSQIYFLQPSCDQTAAPRIFSDFGQSSSCHLWVPSNAIYLVLDEMNPAQANIPVKQVPAGETMTPPPDAVIIDMRYLKGELIPTKQELQSQ